MINPAKGAPFVIDTWQDLFVACMLSGIGALAFNILPMINALWVESYLYDEEQIGWLNGAQLMGFTTGVFSSLYWIGKSTPRSSVIAGLLGSSLVVVLPYLDSPVDWPFLMGAIGFSSALILAPIFALLGRSASVERAYGFMYATQMIFAIVVSYIISGTLFRIWDLKSVMIFLGLLSLLGILLALKLPGKVKEETLNENTAGKIDWRSGGLVLVGMLLFMVGMVGVWSFLDSLESTMPNVGSGPSMLVSVSLLAALAGSSFAVWLDDRIGPFLPLMLGLLLILSGIMFMAASTGKYTFWSGALAASFGWNFALAYATAELAHADNNGNLVALSPGIIGLGGALGTVTLGSVLVSGGVAIFYIVAAGVITLGFLSLLLGANIRARVQIL